MMRCVVFIIGLHVHYCNTVKSYNKCKLLCGNYHKVIKGSVIKMIFLLTFWLISRNVINDNMSPISWCCLTSEFCPHDLRNFAHNMAPKAQISIVSTAMKIGLSCVVLH